MVTFDDMWLLDAQSGRMGQVRLLHKTLSVFCGTSGRASLYSDHVDSHY